MENKKEIIIKVEGEKWTNSLSKAYKTALKNFKLDGFRKGHVPEDMFLKKYTQTRINYDAADLCLEEAYNEMVKEAAGLEIIAEPDVTIGNLDENCCEFKFVLILKPEVKLGEYKNLGVKKDEVNVTDDDVAYEIENLKSHFAEETIKESGNVLDGDIAVIDYEGFKDGVAFDGGKANDYPLEIGSNTFIPGFEEQIIGMAVGEEKDINVTFPEDYHAEDLKGQDVVFKVKVNEIKCKVIPELDEDFFEDLNIEGIDSKEKLENRIRENLTSKRELDAENKYVDELLDAASKNISVDIPEIMVEHELDHMVSEYEETLKSRGINLQMYYNFSNSNEADLKAQMRDEAIKRITYRLMLEEIVKQEKIEVIDDMVSEEVKKKASKYDMEDEAYIEACGGIELLKANLKLEKAIDVLKGE